MDTNNAAAEAVPAALPLDDDAMSCLANLWCVAIADTMWPTVARPAIARVDARAQALRTARIELRRTHPSLTGAAADLAGALNAAADAYEAASDFLWALIVGRDAANEPPSHELFAMACAWLLAAELRLNFWAGVFAETKAVQ